MQLWKNANMKKTLSILLQKTFLISNFYNRNLDINVTRDTFQLIGLKFVHFIFIYILQHEQGSWRWYGSWWRWLLRDGWRIFRSRRWYHGGPTCQRGSHLHSLLPMHAFVHTHAHLLSPSLKNWHLLFTKRSVTLIHVHPFLTLPPIFWPQLKGRMTE